MSIEQAMERDNRNQRLLGFASLVLNGIYAGDTNGHIQEKDHAYYAEFSFNQALKMEEEYQKRIKDD